SICTVVCVILESLLIHSSSDSGSLVQHMLTAGCHTNPPTWSRIVFSVLEGAIAIGLLLAGGLEGLQAASLATALPFSIIMVFMAIAVYRGLRLDDARAQQAHLGRRMDIFSEHVGDVYELRRPDGARPGDGDPIDYRISVTTGPPRGQRRGSRVEEIRKVQHEADEYRAKEQPDDDSGGN